jgi:glycerol-3-phosphate acyltransferase PlsY
MNLMIALLAAAVGYLCGSISFARLVGKLTAPQEDVTGWEIDVPGSGETFQVQAVSATTVSMKIGPRFGCMTSILDMLKVTIPALAFKYLYPETPYFLILATMGMIGHVWPVYHRFKGGRGLSPLYGGMLVFDWLGIFVTALSGMLCGLLVLRDVLAAYMAGLWFLIPWLWFRTHDVWYLAFGVAVNIVFILAMLPELKQYIEIRRERKDIDLSEMMQHPDMGRGMLKLAKRLGLMKDKA